MRASKQPESIADLHLDARNPRVRTPESEALIVRSLQEVGAARSIVIDERNNILAGNGTVQAAAEVGIERVHVVEADGNTIVAVRRIGLTKAQKARLKLLDNVAAERGGWDVELLAAMREEGIRIDDLFEKLPLEPVEQPAFSPEFLAQADTVPSLPGTDGEPQPARLGYAITEDGVAGRGLLLNKKNAGLQLVQRLKDTPDRKSVAAEVAFWAGEMARMAEECGAFDVVSYPPGSGKRGWSLGMELAEGVAEKLGLQALALWHNPNPRANRSVFARKIEERDKEVFVYTGPERIGSVLLVDDIHCTGMTAMRCAKALGAAGTLFLLCLSKH